MSQMLLEVAFGILLAVGSLALVIVLMERTGLGLAKKNLKNKIKEEIE